MPTTVVKTIKSSGGNYASLSAWEAGENGDLVTADEIRVGECYGMLDTTDVIVLGGTVDSTRYLIIRAATGAEAQSPYDTGGTAYRLESSGSVTGCISLQQNYTRIERIQVKATLDDNTVFGIYFGNANFGRVTGCHITQTTPVNFGSTRYGIFSQDAAGDTFLINNIVDWDSRSAATNVYAIVDSNHTSGKTYAYNNTLRCGGNCVNAKGIQDSFGDCVMKNNLVTGFPAACYEFGDPGATGNTNNAASDTTVAGSGAANSRTSQTFTFVSSTDFHLSASDGGAKDFGIDLSGDANYPFSVDFDNATRTGTWDIGADEVTAAPGSPPMFRGSGG